MLVRIFLASALVVSAAPALAQETERPEALERLLGCRALASPEERLECYDREVAAFEAAASAKELVVVDREQVERTRRSLFGFRLPSLEIFGGSDDEEDELDNVETTIRSARRDGLGKWVFVLEDGARWAQIDDNMLTLDPRPGHKIKIRRAAMGSYLANIENMRAIRVRRVE